MDNAATTQPLGSLAQLYAQYADDLWQNPSALYREAGTVRVRMDEVRRSLLEAFGSSAHRCLFTSGGTEGANMVIREGVSRRRDGNYVCAGFEHPCVEETFRALGAGGAEVRFAQSDRFGRTPPEALLDLIDERTQLVSCMHVNNETGARNDVEALARAVKRKNPRTLVHVDGVQAFLRVPLKDTANIDYYTVSAHKVHALKGCGALFYRPKTPLKALLEGGGQEQNLRSGTENTLGILALGEAVRFFSREGEQIRRRLADLNARLRQGLAKMPEAVLLSPPPEESSSHIISVSFPGLRGETLLHMVEDAGVILSTGAACSSHKGKSRAEKALGIPREIAQGAVRISLGAFSTVAEVDRLLAVLECQARELGRTLGVYR